MVTLMQRVRILLEVTNKGLEMQLTWNDRINDFYYSITGNFAYNKNKVTKYKGKLIRGWEMDEDGNKRYIILISEMFQQEVQIEYWKVT